MSVDLVIDIGNTWIKGAFYENHKIIDNFRVKDFSTSVLHSINKKNIRNVLISNVRNIAVANLGIDCRQLIELNHSLQFPFLNAYETPNTLGMDRVAVIAAAASKKTNKNTLIITAGTCITYNLLTSENTFLGGAISPGLNMRYMALEKFTGKLPLIEHENFNALIGKNTEDSIKSGVQNGLIAEVDGVIEQYKAKFKDLIVIMTGGATVFFENKLKNEIFADPNLTFKGLYVILKLNAE